MTQFVFRIRKSLPSFEAVNYYYYPEKAIKIDSLGNICPDNLLDWTPLNSISPMPETTCYSEQEARESIDKYIQYYEFEKLKRSLETYIEINQTLTI
jgi:hypothetical protein